MPALALGLAPADAGIMNEEPRPRHERVITRSMWGGIFFVGAIVAAGTLLMLDACLPGSLIEGSGSLLCARTMAFTMLVFFGLFNVFNASSVLWVRELSKVVTRTIQRGTAQRRQVSRVSKE